MNKHTARGWALVALAWMVALSGCSDDGGDSSGGMGGSNAGGSSGQGNGGTKPTDPCADCAGCCDGSTCLPLASQNDLSCGKGGAKCSTCAEGRTCSAGACVVDLSVCSPLSCGGCCVGTTCVTDSSWSSCSLGGTACQTCEPMARCEGQMTCHNDQWGPDAVVDLYIEQYSVSASQCDDVGSPPDPTITFSILGKTYNGTCDDQYTCTFKPAWKIPNVPLKQFVSGLVKFSITDIDPTSDDSCWSGSLPTPGKREFTSKIFKPGDGTLTYHLRPAGY